MLTNYEGNAILIESIEVTGWNAAIRGMRNSRMNHDQSDSYQCFPEYVIGNHDLDLAIHLIKSSGSERKFMRMIHFSADITASIGFYHDFDTYKVGTTVNSESRMAWLKKNPITRKKFAYMTDDFTSEDGEYLAYLNSIRFAWLNAEDAKEANVQYNRLLNRLPQGYRQTRTIDMNYETLYRIYHERKNHPLVEFREFCNVISKLPYAKELIVDATKSEKAI